MACVTLKRPLDFDPLHSPNRPPTKRSRRCVATGGGPSRHHNGGGGPGQTRHSNIHHRKHQDNTQFYHGRDMDCTSSGSSSVFRESTLTPGEIANNLRDELKRLKRRRQLAPNSPGSPGRGSNPGSPEPMTDGDARSSPSSSTSSNSTSTVVREKPLFTLKQMTLICERMCKERTDQVREEYDKILQQKLSEQYDAFVKFVDHQIQQRFNDSQLPSYLS